MFDHPYDGGFHFWFWRCFFGEHKPGSTSECHILKLLQDVGGQLWQAIWSRIEDLELHGGGARLSMHTSGELTWKWNTVCREKGLFSRPFVHFHDYSGECIVSHDLDLDDSEVRSTHRRKTHRGKTCGMLDVTVMRT